jgi:hypothetical protein
MKNSHGQRNGCQVQMITSESTPGVLDASNGAVNDPQAGHLFRLDGASGAVTNLADVGSQMYAFTGANTSLSGCPRHQGPGRRDENVRGRRRREHRERGDAGRHGPDHRLHP